MWLRLIGRAEAVPRLIGSAKAVPRLNRPCQGSAALLWSDGVHLNGLRCLAMVYMCM